MLNINKYRGGSFEYVIPDDYAFAGTKFVGDFRVNVSTNIIEQFHSTVEYNNDHDSIWTHANIENDGRVSIDGILLDRLQDFAVMIVNTTDMIKSDILADSSSESVDIQE